MSTWSEGYQEEINKLKSDLNLLERSLAKSELKLHKLEEQNKIMKEALKALKLRIHFIDMPQEPVIDMSDQGGPERYPDWQHEIALLEKALEEVNK